MSGKSIAGNKCSFISFPRSGNSFLRKYLESLTGVITGSDLSVKACLATLFAGMSGEQIVDDTVWIIKSHSPFHFKGDPSF